MTTVRESRAQSCSWRMPLSAYLPHHYIIPSQPYTILWFSNVESCYPSRNCANSPESEDTAQKWKHQGVEDRLPKVSYMELDFPDVALHKRIIAKVDTHLTGA